MENIFDFIWFFILLIFLLAFDLYVIHRKSKVITVKAAMFWSVFWITISLLFNVYVYYVRGLNAATDFFTSYLIEKSLSVDNLFVFLLIFEYFKVPKKLEHKVLFLGILGAIVMRGIFIIAGIALIQQFHWVFYVLGIFLIFTGIKFAFEKEKRLEPEKNPILKLVNRIFPVTKIFHEEHFFVKLNGILHMTPLFVTVIIIETSDVIFALDSIPAVLAITSDPFIVYTSNIFAILGLRSLYFCLSHFMNMFYYLHFGLAAILVFIGTKMVLTDVVKISTIHSLGVIVGILTFFIILSYRHVSNKKGT